MNHLPFPPGGGPERRDHGDGGDLETRLRQTLTDRAESIAPTDRWRAIRAGITDSAEAGRTGSVTTLSRPRAARTTAGMPHWLLPVAASFLVVLVGAGVWATTRPRAADPTPAGASTILEDPPPDAALRGLATATTTTWSAPIYYIQAQPDSTWALQRDFVPAQLTDTSKAARVTLALTTLLGGRLPSGAPLPAYPGIQSPWQPDTTVTAKVTATQIDVVLSQPGHTDLPAERQRVAVQSLTWTATAAAQQNVPVRISAAGDTPVFPTRPVGPYQRPAAAYEDLAPIWITDPLRYLKVISTRPITIDGQACVVEGALRWELRRADGSLVKDGSTTAKSACPTRGTWRIELGMLGVGDYRLRVFSTSPKDGTIDAETESPFTVS